MLEVSTHQVPQVKRSKVRNNGDPPIKLFPMAFFYGATADSTGGASVCIWINKLHYLSSKLGCGHSTNTRVELLALWALLYIAKDIGLPYLHVFGNSSVIINWAKGEFTLAMVNLEAWCNNTKKIISSFTYVDFSHVYREYNKRADILSKAGLNMVSGHLTFTKICEGELFGEVELHIF